MINLMSNVPHPALPLLTFSCPSRTQSSKGAYHLQLGFTWISPSFEHRGLDLPWFFFQWRFFFASEVLISFFSASPLARSKIICPAPTQRRGCRHLQVSWNQVGALQKVPRPLGRAKDRVATSARPRSCTDGGEMGGLASEVWTRHHFSHQQRGYDGDVMENVGITMGNIIYGYHRDMGGCTQTNYKPTINIYKPTSQ